MIFFLGKINVVVILIYIVSLSCPSYPCVTVWFDICLEKFSWSLVLDQTGFIVFALPYLLLSGNDLCGHLRSGQSVSLLQFVIVKRPDMAQNVFTYNVGC